LPEVTEELDDLARAGQEISTLRDAMSEDIETFAAEREALLSRPEKLHEEPFPRHSYKHALVGCLNDLRSDEAQAPEVQEASAELGLQCRVEVLHHFLEELEASTPARRDEALSRLRAVDGLRALRVRIDSRALTIPDLIERSRKVVSARRSAVRKAETEIQRRAPEYRSDRLEQANERVRQVRIRIAELEARVERLAQDERRWRARLDREVIKLYFSLVSL
jgi:hypothetical protein